MALVKEESKERVRDAVDFVDLVGARVDLRRAGPSRYEGLCPFHEERTPSFGIDPVKKVYHCFGCQAGGDVFRYVMETEGLEFPDALRMLAERYGVELEVEEEDPESAARRRRRERLLELLERTAAYYVRVLWDAPEAAKARRYLAERGLEEQVLRRFRVGYAPSAWDRVLTASLRAGFSAEELTAAGLAQRSRQGSPYDRFRSRIMFPLADRRGRVLGFGARSLGDGDGPKYLNTSDGELYRKGRHVFGADLARAAAGKTGSVVVVEGYTDVIALHQAGLENSVGIMGTALTEEQVDEVAVLAPRVEMALDADAAGQAAMLRAARVAAGRQLDLRVVDMPAGKDPADLVLAEGAEAMRARTAASIPFVRFGLERALERADLTSADGRDRARAEVAPMLGELPRGVLRDELTRVVASRLGLHESIVEELAAQRAPPPAPPAPVTGETRAPAPPPRRPDRREETERRFLAFCVAMPEQGREALRAVREEEHFTSELSRRAVRHLRDKLATPLTGLPDDDHELVSLVSELVVRAGSEPAVPAALTVEALQLEKGRLERRMAAAREEGGLEVDELAAERETVLRRLREAMAP